MTCPETIYFQPFLLKAYIKSKVLASPDPDSRDCGVVVLTEENDAAKSMLPHTVKALEHAWRTEVRKNYSMWFSASSSTNIFQNWQVNYFFWKKYILIYILINSTEMF